MTNAEKYLKDGVSVEEFCKGFYQYLVSKDKISFGYDQSNVGAYLQDFLNEQTKPTLTEDERVILRNIDKQFIKIGKEDRNTIYFIFEGITKQEQKYYADIFNNLFQFIKERRRIRDKGIVERLTYLSTMQ